MFRMCHFTKLINLYLNLSLVRSKNFLLFACRLLFCRLPPCHLPPCRLLFCRLPPCHLPSCRLSSCHFATCRFVAYSSPIFSRRANSFAKSPAANPWFSLSLLSLLCSISTKSSPEIIANFRIISSLHSPSACTRW